LITQNPDAEEQLRLLYNVLREIEDDAGFTPTSVGTSQEWASIVSTVEENRASYCEALSGKPLYSALYGSCTVALQELKGLLKASVQAQCSVATKSTEPSRQQEDGFTEVRRRKRQNSQETGDTNKKAATLPAAAESEKGITTRNFFAPHYITLAWKRTPRAPSPHQWRHLR
jgi:hypothetical protein